MIKEHSVMEYIFFILVVYLYIYNPVFRVLGVSFLKLFFLISVIYFMLRKNTIEFYKFTKNEFFIFGCIFIIAFCMGGVVGSYNLRTAVKHFQAFCETFIIGYTLAKILKLYKFDISNLIIIISTIASFITLFLLLNPKVSLYIRTNVITDSLVDIGYDAASHSFRSFGIAEGLTSIYGVIQGYMAAYCLFIAIKRQSIKYYFPIPLMLLSALVNARTGVLIFCLAIPYYIYSIIKKRKVFQLCFIITLMVLLLIILLKSGKVKKTMEWGIGMFKDILNLFHGEKSGNFSVISNMIFFPESAVDLLFGCGSLAVNSLGQGSDISFINQIYMGGLIYFIFIVLFCCLVGYKFYKVTNNKYYVFFIICSLFMINFKGMDVTKPNGLIRLLYLQYFALIQTGDYYVYKKRKNHFLRYVVS